MPGPRLALAAAFVTATVLAAPGCKKTPQRIPPSSSATTPRARTPAGPRLPAPHQLSQMPDAGVFIAEPAGVLAGIDAYAPEAPTLTAVAEFVLRMQAPAELAGKLAAQVVGDRPWAGVHVAGEDIIALPARPTAADALKGFPTTGDFGAVELPAPTADSTPRDQKPPAPRLAWFDEQTNTLVFATTLQGLATSRKLAATYGSRPIWVTLGEARVRDFVAEFPYARIAAAGQGLHSLDLHVLEAPGKPLPSSPDLGNGALTGMLKVPELAAGISTRWPGHKKAVADAIKQMNAGVDRAGFAAKLMLDPLVDQAARAMRRWNGRVAIGTGPARHLRLGLGADDPAAGFRDLVGCLRTLVDNLSLARMFADVPGASFKKAGDDPTVYLLTVDGVARHVPSVGKSLLDDKGRLRVAFAANERAGGLLVVIGPDPTPIVQRWAKAVAEGEPAKNSTDDLLSAVLAVGPERLQPLLNVPPTSQSAVATEALKLEADRAPTLMVVQRKPDRYFATVRGPELTVDTKRRARE